MLKLLQSLLNHFLDAPRHHAMMRRQEIHIRQQRWLDYLR